MILTFIRNRLADKSDDFTFKRFNYSDPVELKDNAGLYIHIPFCKNFCPYCPYNKINYSGEIALGYKDALIKEINLYHRYFGRKSFSSLYIGGGTPTLMINELDEILDHLHKHFNISGSIAIETTPNIIDKKILEKLKTLGFNLISLGIQSFNNQHLKKIGRAYDSATALKSVDDTLGTGFDSVNIDLIFAIENQTLEDIRNDLSNAINMGVNQITCYPLFTFPYSEIGEFKKLKKIKLPNNMIRRKMYYFIHSFLKDNGYERTTIWSFNKDHKETYSSVTRNYYLGLGAGAGSYNGTAFYFNTFSVPDYINSVKSSLPVSINMNISQKLERIFWLYWKFYETEISKKQYREMFKTDLENDFGSITKMIRFLRFIEIEDENIIRLNLKGSHWIHLIQNHYALNYVSKIWAASKSTPWPEKIVL